MVVCVGGKKVAAGTVVANPARPTPPAAATKHKFASQYQVIDKNHTVVLVKHVFVPGALLPVALATSPSRFITDLTIPEGLRRCGGLLLVRNQDLRECSPRIVENWENLGNMHREDQEQLETRTRLPRPLHDFLKNLPPPLKAALNENESMVKADFFHALKHVNDSIKKQSPY